MGGATVPAGEVGRETLEPVAPPGNEQEVVARFGEDAGEGFADARRGAGHDGQRTVHCGALIAGLSSSRRPALDSQDPPQDGFVALGGRHHGRLHRQGGPHLGQRQQSGA